MSLKSSLNVSFYILAPNYQEILQALLSKVILNPTTFSHHPICVTVVSPLHYCKSLVAGLSVSTLVAPQPNPNAAARVTKSLVSLLLSHVDLQKILQGPSFLFLG